MTMVMRGKVRNEHRQHCLMVTSRNYFIVQTSKPTLDCPDENGLLPGHLGWTLFECRGGHGHECGAMFYLGMCLETSDRFNFNGHVIVNK
jgi:hypothetical protein